MINNVILYIYCMLVREIWKCIHPRVSYSPWVNKFAYFLYPHAINVLLYRMKPGKHIYVKYCWQTYSKSIGTLSQIFKNHIVTSPANDAFRVPLTFSCERTITLAGKPARIPKWWNMIIISRNMILSCVITCSDFYPLSNEINLFMVINIWGIIIYLRFYYMYLYSYTCTTTQDDFIFGS